MNHSAKTYTVSKSKLLEILRANRDKHVADYEAAKAGFRKAAIAALAEKLRLMQGEGDPGFLKVPGSLDLLSTLHRVLEGEAPESHASSYDRLIGLLELTVDTELQIDEREYDTYVRDDWQWRHDFLMRTANYSSK